MPRKGISADQVWAIDDTIACPYPGARPLTGEAEEVLLRGRGAIADDLLRDVASKRVIELTADSGVGKSSLLDALIVPRLRKRGARVVVLRSWANLIVARDADLYATAVQDALLSGESNDIDGVEGLTGTELIEELDRKYNNSLVLVFDQLEELFRDDSAVGRRFVAELAEQALKRDFHHILSLRSEYKVGLEPVERTVPTDLWRWYPLPHLSSKVAPEVIEAPAALTGADDEGRAFAPFSWEPRAVEELTAWWAAAKDYSWQVGLLHLQALLWVTFHKTRPDRDSIITMADVLDHWPDAPKDGADLSLPSERERCVRLFETALRDYVEGRLGGTFDGDSALTRERLYAMARIVPHLSSVGYKLVRESTELALLSLPGYEDLRLPRPFLPAAILAARALSGGKRSDLTAEEVYRRLGKVEFAEDLGVLAKGDESIPSGRMKGLAPAETASALVAAFENGLQRLKEESIVRFTPTVDGLLRVSMVHDGFGPALNAWSEKVQSNPVMTIESLTAISSRQLFKGGLDGGGVVRRERFGPDRSAGENGVVEIENVGWISCYIDAEFHGVTFRACDLRSTFFKNCHFADVLIVDGQLSGTLFVNCTFDGVAIDGPNLGVFPAEGNSELRLKTLTMKHCHLVGGGLAIKNVSGYGLFFDDCDGGPWMLEACDLMHVMVDIGPQTHDQAGRIVECPRISYLSGTPRTAGILPAIDAASNVTNFNKEFWESSDG